MPHSRAPQSPHSLPFPMHAESHGVTISGDACHSVQTGFCVATCRFVFPPHTSCGLSTDRSSSARSQDTVTGYDLQSKPLWTGWLCHLVVCLILSPSHQSLSIFQQLISISCHLFPSVSLYYDGGVPRSCLSFTIAERVQRSPVLFCLFPQVLPGR